MRLPTILKGKDMPKHLAINATRLKEWIENKKKPSEDAIKKHIDKINEIIDIQIKQDIPVMTIHVFTRTEDEILSVKTLVRNLTERESIKTNKIRIFVIGDWFGLDHDLRDSIITLTERTKEYDNYFINLCINYDGQKEILTAVKLLLKKAEADKISIDKLTIEQIKDNLPSSYSIPPDLIIENDMSYSGLLLWDSKGAVIYYTGKYWLDFEKSDFDKAISFFNEKKKLE